MVSRVPYFCSVCPHNSSTKPLPGTLVGAGIGCHALVMLMDEEQAGTVTGVSQMGGQRPASGMTVPQIVRLLQAEGVAKVIVTTEDLSRYRNTKMPNGVAVWDRSRLDEAQRVLAATRGVTVLVHDQECATEKRRKRKRGKLAQPAARAFINERICEGCGDCRRTSNC